MAKKRRPAPAGRDALTHPTPGGGDLEMGREYYARRDWAAAFEYLSRAHAGAPLACDDLELLVASAILTGHYDASFEAQQRLYQACHDRGDVLGAARAAFWLCWWLFYWGQSAQASAWMARSQRLVEHSGNDCAERGYLLLPEIIGVLEAGDHDAAHAKAGEAIAIGERFQEADLTAFAQHLRGRALMRSGRVRDGLQLADEAMLAATSGALSPMITGLIYCAVILSCQQVFAWDRASEWTMALTNWCEDEPQIVAFTRTCRVHRAEVTQLGGDWPGALEQARDACQSELPPDPRALADGWYQQAEVHRLRGDWDAAEAAYGEASGHGREPQPGLALMRLAQGRLDDAVGAINRVLDGTDSPWRRACYLPASVEIALAEGEMEQARAATDELADIAEQFDTEVLAAMAAHARGAVNLAAGDAREALAPLRAAFEGWQCIGAPYIAARIRVQLSRAYEALGDGDGTRLEREAASRVFQDLGAAPDLAALQEPAASAAPCGLSKREIQVLRLVAAGNSNKAIADELFLSARTVDRHLSNIFIKLDVASRTEAAAFAYRHGLI